MSINTEAAELLHAVADLYECGALKWVAPGATDLMEAQSSIGNALIHYCDLCNVPHHVRWNAIEELDLLTPNGWLTDWQDAPGRNTRHVISLLRRAAQRLEEA